MCLRRPRSRLRWAEPYSTRAQTRRSTGTPAIVKAIYRRQRPTFLKTYGMRAARRVDYGQAGAVPALSFQSRTGNSACREFLTTEFVICRTYLSQRRFTILTSFASKDPAFMVWAVRPLQRPPSQESWRWLFSSMVVRARRTTLFTGLLRRRRFPSATLPTPRLLRRPRACLTT